MQESVLPGPIPPMAVIFAVRKKPQHFGTGQSMGGFHSHGGTSKWMEDDGKAKKKMDDDWGYPYDSGNHHLGFPTIWVSDVYFTS